MKMKRHVFSLFFLVALYTFSFITSEALAEILVAQTRTLPWVYGGASYIVDFNGSTAGGKVFTFSTTQPNTRIVITFNAECAVDGNAFDYIDIDIIVNLAGPTGDTVVPPSNGDNAFCSGNDTASDFIYGAGDGWVSAVTQATMVLPEAGNHTVRVRVNGNLTVSRLDDMSLIVQR